MCGEAWRRTSEGSLKFFLEELGVPQQGDMYSFSAHVLVMLRNLKLALSLCIYVFFLCEIKCHVSRHVFYEYVYFIKFPVYGKNILKRYYVII